MKAAARSKPRALGKLRRREGVADRAQILELVLGRGEALGQRGEVLGLDHGLATQALDERVVADVARVHVVDVALARVGLGVQTPQLHVLVLGPLAHDIDLALGRTPVHPTDIFPHPPSISVHGYGGGARQRRW
jgi:hypothetical protein